MKKKKHVLHYLIFMLLPVAGCKVTNTELSFQPNGAQGKDAFVEKINGLPALESRNFGSADQLLGMAWTFSGLGGDDGYVRTFIDFTDLQSIPQGTKVNYAYLSLYGVPASRLCDKGSFGSNDGYIQRVTAPWDENAVTWNIQPATTTTNQVTVPGSNGVQWNFHVSDLDITTLVQDLINLPPAERYGFCLRVQTEEYYRSLLFASSDYADTTKHPKLRIGVKVKRSELKGLSADMAGTVKP